jgi:hypothetical protein
VEDQINDANGAVFAVYTNAGAPLPIADAFTNISAYFDGTYFTGTMPPVPISYTPYTAVIDMRTGEVIAVDVQSVSAILSAVGAGG